MESAKRNHTWRWTWRVACLLLIATLVMPPAVMAGGYGWGHRGHYHRGYHHGYHHGYYNNYAWVPLAAFGVAMAGIAYFTWVESQRRTETVRYVYVDPPPTKYVYVNPPAPAQAKPSSQPRLLPLGTAQANAPLLNVRSGPGKSYGVVITVEQGNTMTIFEKKGAWLYVQTQGGRFGWVERRFTIEQASEARG